MSTADDEVWIAIKRGEGYEDVHPDLVAEDAMGDSTFEWRVLPAAPTAAAHGGAEFFFGARIAAAVAQPLPATPLSETEILAMRVFQCAGIRPYFDKIAFARAIERACAEKWGVKLADSKEKS